MYCKKCGAENQDGAKFCKKCGMNLQEESAPVSGGNAGVQDYQPYQGQPYQGQPYQGQNHTAGQKMPQYQESQIPPEYKPISMWGYFGYSLLFSIPIVGLVVVLIFAFGGTSNVNLKNYARGQFCSLIIVVILVVIIALAGGMAAYSYSLF